MKTQSFNLFLILAILSKRTWSRSHTAVVVCRVEALKNLLNVIVVLHEIGGTHAQLRLQAQLHHLAILNRRNNHVHVIDEAEDFGVDSHVYRHLVALA